MILPFLIPGVEDAEEPDLGAETLGIFSVAQKVRTISRSQNAPA